MVHNSAGDLLWLNRHPGGWCLFLESEDHVDEDSAEVVWERYTVVHPTDGVITDADWYFTPHGGSEE
jgi:hypothetical protein